jgi:hypothetical protein
MTTATGFPMIFGEMTKFLFSILIGLSLLFPVSGIVQTRVVWEHPVLQNAASAAQTPAAPDPYKGCPVGENGQNAGIESDDSFPGDTNPLATLRYVPQISFLFLFQPYQAIPQVYLPIFQPPQNLA